MPTKILTQDAKAVKSLIEFVTGKQCKELPATFDLANGSTLTKSNKEDVYYMTTSISCSCPGFAYNRTCKHIKAIQSRRVVEASRNEARAYQARQRRLKENARVDSSEASESIRPMGKWAGGHNGPVLA